MINVTVIHGKKRLHNIGFTDHEAAVKFCNEHSPMRFNEEDIISSKSVAFESDTGERVQAEYVR